MNKLEYCDTVKILCGIDDKIGKSCGFEIRNDEIVFSFLFSGKIPVKDTDICDYKTKASTFKLILNDGKEIVVQFSNYSKCDKFYDKLRIHFGTTKEEIKAEKKLLKDKNKADYYKMIANNPPTGNNTKDTSNKKVCCPKCGSNSITANKKGFGLCKGALGVATFGAYGVMAAGIGKNKIIITCLNCGHKWKPGK